MKKITHKEIGKVLGVTPSAITQRLNSANGFYMSEAKKLSLHFGVPFEAWLDIKSYLQNNCTPKNKVQQKHNRVTCESR
jgi:plasmid maintenance system antidote protein VapI